MNREVMRAVAQHNMIGEGDSLVVAVSGGADSVTLLHFLRELAPSRSLRLTAAHLNHRLRGAESDRDEAFVRALCREWDIPLLAESAPVAALARARGHSVEQCARDERYAFFRRCMERAGACAVATAHTLDDSAETVLLNLTRGGALRALCGIPPVRALPGGGRVVRPLIGCTRGDIEAYCTRHGLGYVTDSTNLSDRYTRNRLRRQVLPVLREVNPGFPRNLAGMTASLRADADYLDALARDAAEQLCTGAHSLDAAALLARPEPVRRRVLLQLLARHDVPGERRRVEQLEALLREGGALQLSAAWICRCDKKQLRFAAARRDAHAAFAPVTLRLPVKYKKIPVFSDKTLCIRHAEGQNLKKNGNNQENQFKNTLDCDRIKKIVMLRQRLPGDRIRLAGRGCTKSLKKLFNEAGLTETQRQRTLVLADEAGELLWVEGFGAAEGVRAGPDTRDVLVLDVREA